MFWDYGQNKYAYFDLNRRILKLTRLCKEETNSEYHNTVTKLNLFYDAPVRQNGNSVNVREFLIMAYE